MVRNIRHYIRCTLHSMWYQFLYTLFRCSKMQRMFRSTAIVTMERYSPWIFILLLWNGCLQSGSAQQVYSTALETELRTSLFTGYEVLQRPSQTVNVNVSMSLLYINDLDIKSQTFSTSGYFTMHWSDSRLQWSNNSTYTNVRFLFSTQTYMWRPAVVIENSNEDLAIFSDDDAMIRILPSGMTVWNPGGLFNTHCEADITYYPLDVQECSIVLTTWAYTANEILLSLMNSEPIDLNSFKENGEWIIDKASATAQGAASRGSDSSNTYSTVTFTFKLKRRPLFHVLNTLFPVVLLASLVCCVFKLPPESGERVGMSLTVLLAYAVYLTLISDNIPQTSLNTSILSVYLTIILMLSALSVLSTIFVLDIYFNHEDDEEIPMWIQKVTTIILVRITCWKGTTCCNNRISTGDNSEESGNFKHDISNGKLPVSKSDKEKQAIDDGEVESESDREKLSWKEVALIVDKCLMYSFIFMVVVCTVVCLALLASQS